ncbi:nucleolar and spindle-associated protein 1 isoform 3-T3 [Synchiropus picturatus]
MAEDLDSMKYADLQRLAKKLGIKARMKADKLLKAVKQHYEQEKEAEKRDESTVDFETPAQEDDQVQPESSHPTVFVNTRRGRGKAMKRKSLLETESKDLSSDGDDTLPLEDLQPSAVSSPKSGDKEVSTPGITKAKKRHVSTENGSKLQPEVHDEAPSKCDTGRPQEKALLAAKSGGIPRLKKAKSKTFTPNFKKMHEAQFNKMESIDSYVQRKNKQKEMLKSSAKETQKANPGRTSMFSPAPSNKRPVEDKRRLTYSAAKKEDVPFRPSVLSTRRINVRFSEATRDNEYKGSLIKTPARMSPCVTSITPKTNDVGKLNNSRTSMLSTSKTNGTFVFSANTTATPGTHKKPTFDLKASLSRPLGYKPHTGKLKPFGEWRQNANGNKSLIMNTHEKNYKQHRVQTREVRRVKHTEERKQKKDNMLGARRGLVMM